MTEAQKYEGALYKEKPAKNQQKGKKDSKQIVKANTNGNHRQPYVEDAPDADNLKANMAPPPAPSPPPPGTEKSSATPQDTDKKPVNVFDFLVTDQTPNASKVSLGAPKEQMEMVDHAPSVFEPSKALARLDTEGEDEDKEYDVAYEENGFSYGAGPIHPSLYSGKVPNVSMEFMTPAPKKKKDRTRVEKGSGQASGTVSDKKRKRGPTEDMDTDAAMDDTPMMDAPSSVLNHPGTPMLNHSGLTGGLNRLLRSPSIEADDQNKNNSRRRYQDPSSPIKRTRRNEKETNSDAGRDTGLGISIKDRAGRLVSSMFGGSAVSGSSGSTNDPSSKAIVRTRRRSSSDDGQLVEVRRPRRSTRGRISNGDAEGESRKTKRKTSAQTDGDRPPRRLKQIEYRRDADRSRSRSPRRDGREVVVYRQPNVPDELQREMAAHFLSLVNKGPESSRGLSINKALKRFHRDFSDEFDDDRGRGHGRSRADRERRFEDEKELWRTLRLKRNDRGEVVVFF